MRGRLAILLAFALVLLAACGNPAGVDGDLTNGWAAAPAPSGFTPVAGTCHLGNFAPVGTRVAYDEVDCALRHRTETVYVGTFPSPAADAAVPPIAGSAGARDAYRTCDLRTIEYVGAQWRDARLWIGVTQPSAVAWSGGARWFRCDVLEVSSIENDGGLVQRTGTLQDALQEPASPLLLTCYAVQTGSTGAIATMPPTSCRAKHNAEYVGIWYASATAAFPKSDAQWAAFHDGCRHMVASYVAVPDDGDLQYRAGVVSLPPGLTEWNQGDRGVRCYLWLDDTTLTATLKGKGAAALPIRYK